MGRTPSNLIQIASKLLSFEMIVIFGLPNGYIFVKSIYQMWHIEKCLGLEKVHVPNILINYISFKFIIELLGIISIDLFLKISIALSEVQWKYFQYSAQ